MVIILSISEANETLWAAGPNGLFQLQAEQLIPIPQPMERLACTLALGSRLLVGGAPYGIAYTSYQEANWQAAWTSGCQAAVLVLAADPDIDRTGVLLAGTEGEGVLRSTDRGGYWAPCNFGLRNYTVLSLAWAPPAPASQWPRRDVVFATTEEGIYRSPNGGRAWKRAECPESVYQIVAISPSFHEDGVVMAGSETAGLWRSVDGGRTFDAIERAPEQINALCTWHGGWLLSDIAQLWHSQDGINWHPLPVSEPALILRPYQDRILAGSEDGLSLLDKSNFQPARRFKLPQIA